MREGVSQRELNEFRKEAAEYLTDRADIYSLKPVGTDPILERPKGRQRWPDDYTARLTSRPIRVKSAQWRKEETLQAGQVRARGDWILSFENETGVTAEDTVKCTAATRTVGLRGRVFSVIGLLNGSDEIIRIAEASEIT